MVVLGSSTASASRAAVLGIDLGSTSVKAALIDETGEALAVAQCEYEWITPDPVIVELDPETYWAALKMAVAQLLSQSGINPEAIKAIGWSVQGETLLAVDRVGTPVRPVIVWADNRAQAEAAELDSHFGKDVVYRTTGQVSVVPTWPASKILWMRRNEPELFRRTAKFLLLEDFVIHRLTGKYVCEGSLITSTVYWDLTTKRWWPEMLAYLGISPEQLPEIRESGEVVGPLLPTVATELGLSASTIVCTGALDQAAGAIGVGNIAPGIFSVATGGALAICATVDQPTFDPAARMPCHYHGLPDRYMAHSFTTGGMVLRWFRDAFCQSELSLAQALDRDAYDLLTEQAARVAPGCDGLLMLPHLQGAMAPESNPRARGVFYGFTVHHEKAHYIRAILESIACLVRRNLEVVEDMGIPVRELRVLGGGARSDLWTQINSDVTNRPAVRTASRESPCLGAAILAGTAVNMFSSVKDAVNALVHLEDRFEPDPLRRDIYDTTYERYCRLYMSLVKMFDTDVAFKSRP